MTRLILIRHAQSVANAERRFTHGPEEPLSQAGREEARETALRLRAALAPAALYSSPYARALETAALLGEALGLAPRCVEALREQHFGALQGQPYAAFQTGALGAEAGPWRVRAPGGETLEEVARRAGPALEELAARHVGEEIVVVSHGGVMAALRAWVAGDFAAAPVLTRNAGGFLLVRAGARWDAPLDLAEDGQPLSRAASPPRAP